MEGGCTRPSPRVLSPTSLRTADLEIRAGRSSSWPWQQTWLWTWPVAAQGVDFWGSVRTLFETGLKGRAFPPFLGSAGSGKAKVASGTRRSGGGECAARSAALSLLLSCTSCQPKRSQAGEAKSPATPAGRATPLLLHRKGNGATASSRSLGHEPPGGPEGANRPLANCPRGCLPLLAPPLWTFPLQQPSVGRPPFRRFLSAEGAPERRGAAALGCCAHHHHGPPVPTVRNPLGRDTNVGVKGVGTS